MGAAATRLSGRIPADSERDLILQDLLAAAADYIADYETTPWAILAEERYQQTSTRGGSRQQQRALRSDVFLASAGAGDWIWLRDVLEVDGVSLKREPDRLHKILVDAPSNAQAQVARIMSEGMAHHLGNVLRTVDAPTMDLHLLRRETQKHLRFTLEGSKSLEGKRYGVVSLAASEAAGLPYFSGAVVRGKFWIDPATGCVAQSEIRLESRFREGKITVRYANQPQLGRWVPIRVDEEDKSFTNYTTGTQVGSSDLSVLLTGRAEYRNFRRISISARPRRLQAGGRGGA